ncbi:MAG: HEAT repeat domain-containing protein [Actinomycetota bacterium]|nr:HEAT repeat domain-containing protein [Actinomycetota bacterium]
MRSSRHMADHIARRREAALAGHTGDEATARAHMADADASVRATALGALARLSALRPADLDAALRDPDPRVRRRGAEVVAGLGDDPLGIDVAMIGLLADPDPSVVEVAAWACGERSPAEPGVVAALAALTTGHGDALIREAAVAALGSMGDAEGLPAILVATSDKATVRRRAVLALASFDGPEVSEALERARTDRDWQVRQAAEDLLDD